MGTKAFAPAKVNLALYLTGLRADGYHLLDSLVVFADVGDWLTASPAATLSLTLGGPRSAGVPTDDSNLVLRAAHLLRRLRQVSLGAAIHLDKHLPHGGGIGGGSSDAAATIRLLADLWQVPPLTPTEALPLGADIPVCLAAPCPTRMRGIGEILTPAPPLPPGWLVLVNPGIHLPTAAVFKQHDLRVGASPNDPHVTLDTAPQPRDPQGFTHWLHTQHNTLTNVVSTLACAPVIQKILHQLRHSPGCHATDMSGSGSTCWAWFSDQALARAAAENFVDEPGFWTAVARTLTPQDPLLSADRPA